MGSANSSTLVTCTLSPFCLLLWDNAVSRWTEDAGPLPFIVSRHRTKKFLFPINNLLSDILYWDHTIGQKRLPKSHGPSTPLPWSLRTIEEKQFFRKHFFSPLPVRERSSPVNGRSRVRAGVVAGTDTPPVELNGDVVLVTFVQQDAAVLICGNLVRSKLDITGEYRPLIIFYQKSIRFQEKWRASTMVYFLLVAMTKCHMLKNTSQKESCSKITLLYMEWQRDWKGILRKSHVNMLDVLRTFFAGDFTDFLWHSCTTERPRIQILCYIT